MNHSTGDDERNNEGEKNLMDPIFFLFFLRTQLMLTFCGLKKRNTAVQKRRIDLSRRKCMYWSVLEKEGRSSSNVFGILLPP